MTAKKAASRRGRNVNLYLRDEDVAKIRELSSWVLSKGLRSSDSLIVRAALKVASSDKRFLAAYEEAASVDQRFKGETTE